jgi:hypothetical protein
MFPVRYKLNFCVLYARNTALEVLILKLNHNNGKQISENFQYYKVNKT